ncbi:MAG TPA: hypothetical protein VLG39_09765 [Nitrospirota bacterium]|nr:hypothetical protein [Nitrospirota bacterium]
MNKRIIRIYFWLIMLLGVGMPPAWMVSEGHGASDKEVQTVIQSDLAAQANPEGLMVSVGGFRRWIMDTDKNLGIPSSYLQTGVGAASTPAYGRASVHAEWLAAVFAKLRIEYDYYRFYGTNTSLLSFPSGTAPFGRADVEARKGTEQAGNGNRFLIRPTLYAKAGPVVIVNQTDLAYFHFTGRGPYFLDWTYETLLRDGDHLVENRTSFLYQAIKGPEEVSFLVGPYYEILHTAAADLNRQRAGVMAYWVPRDALGSFKRPRLFAQIGQYIKDSNREGEYTGAIAIGFDIDL